MVLGILSIELGTQPSDLLASQITVTGISIASSDPLFCLS